jgi:tetratricopeptide (TPR) repeat protein
VGAAALFTLTGCNTGPSAPAMKQLGDLAFEERDYLKAVEWYEQYIQRLPLDAESRYKLAASYLALKRPTQAREQFLQGLELGDPEAEFLEGVATALVETDQRQELFRVLRGHAERTRRPRDYIRFGQFALLVGDPDVAQEALLDAARIDLGRTVEPQLALAEFYEAVGDEQSRLDRLRMALFLAPEDPEIQEQIRSLGEVPGPAFVLIPTERQ